jgi:hypothetical protein
MRVKIFRNFARDHTKMRAGRRENARKNTKMRAWHGENARLNTIMRAKWEKGYAREMGKGICAPRAFLLLNMRARSF